MKTEYPDLRLFINGEWRTTDKTQPVVNPANEEIIGHLPVAGKTELDDALKAAQQGFKIWSRTSPRQRAELIRQAAHVMRERQDEIAQAITLEQGKPLAESRLEVIRGAEFFEWDAGEALRTYGRVIPSAQGIRYIVHHQPIGPVAAFSPWNFPMSQPSRKVAGALAAGCSIILKAAEETPAGALHIARAFEEVGLPKGVLNLVFGVPNFISSHLIPSETTRMVAFTGSTAVGRHLSMMAAEHMTPVLMELGGHAPVIVSKHTDVQAAATASAHRKTRNAGQVCTSPTRFFVHRDIFDEFLEKMSKDMAATVVGDGQLKTTSMGPLANARRISALESFVNDAVAVGAKLVTGGNRIARAGFFFEPTVLANVPNSARVMNEEPFGPLAIVNPFNDIESAIVAANSVQFGLAAYGFSNRADEIDLMTDNIEAGNLSINTLEASLPETPFGGVKSSGYGREGGSEGIHHYMVTKNVSHSMRIE